MVRAFQTATFSLSGLDHRRSGRESQDTSLCEQRDTFVLMLVSDGVGQSLTSRVGAIMLTQATRRLVLSGHDRLVREAKNLGPQVFGDRFVSWLTRELGAEIARARAYLGNQSEDELTLSATLLGCFMTDSAAVIFGCGDGVVAVNGDVRTFSCLAENQPNLPIYAVTNSSNPNLDRTRGELRVLWTGSPQTIESVLVGTDGVQALLPVLIRAQGVQSEARSWVEDLICRSLGVAANGSLPHDDATLVAAWRTDSDGPAARVL